MTLRLERYHDSGQATRGLLFFRDRFLCYTLERPWEHNRPSRSCIPPGTYDVRPWTRPNGDHVFIVSGGSVCTTPDLLNEDKGLTRCLILFHSANYVNEIAGCIAPGTGVSNTAAGYSVTRSRNAMELLHNVLKPKLSTQPWIGLDIRNYWV